MSTYFSTDINEKAADILRAVINTGLYGETESEVVACMLLKGIQEAVASGFVKMDGPDVEDPEAPIPATKFECEHCEDGLALSIPDETPEGKCPKCGSMVALPF